ncbi:MAG TPA: DUF2330 domain-containing protein [Acidimicrobiales bacterium]|nr:DUF2330 domain-containing protein [Acidimicrobiales bacterium]
MRKRMGRVGLAVVAAAVAVGVAASPAGACGGLIGRNGAVNLVKTTTLAAYHEGVEHYVTAFKFAGGGGEFGSIVPLPGVPTDIERGGDWTLQRLQREVAPPPPEFAGDSDVRALAASAPAEVVMKAKVDALDLTVLKGGGASVGEWATQNGFLLPPDTPEVLDFYASRSPIFLAAKFDADVAREKGVSLGDGTPVHLTIPTPNPWVPLRILSLGRQPGERVDADVFLLNDRRPTILTGEAGEGGLVLDRDEPASGSLLADLRSDKGMDWMPDSMWLSYVKIEADPGDLTYDLAVDASGAGQPSRVAAGLGPEGVVLSEEGSGGASGPSADQIALVAGIVVGLLALGAAGFVALRPARREA